MKKNKVVWINGLVVALFLFFVIPDEGFGHFAIKNDQSAMVGYQVGDVVADFNLKNINGGHVSLADLKDKKGVIVVFMSNQCPFARAYEERLIAIDQRFAPQGFPVLAINSSEAAGSDLESFASMQERAKSKGFPYPYLQDDSQKTARLFGAAKTPHVFVLKNSGGKFSVQYIGAFDDNPQDPNGVNKRYAEEAVTNILQGKPVVTTTTRAIGCAIKFKSIR